MTWPRARREGSDEKVEILLRPMNAMENYILWVAQHFKARLGPALVEIYKIGSLAHGGFSAIYSDLDVGLLLGCAEPPAAIAEYIAEAKARHPDYGKKLSVFWGNPEYPWGRLPVIDRLDLLDHGEPLLHNHLPAFLRPDQEEIRGALLESLQKSWLPRLDDLSRLPGLEPKDRKPYIRAVLYPARFIYTWDCLAVDSNDRAVQYLHRVQPAGLDLRPIDLALACRQEKCSADDVFALRTNLESQFASTLSYVAEMR